MATASSLYNRIGGYDTIVAVIDEYLARLMADPAMARFEAARSTDSKRRTRQLSIDYLSEQAGGPSFYLGRDMKTAHVGVGISAREWELAMGHLGAALAKCKVPEKESREFAGLFEALRGQIVER